MPRETLDLTRALSLRAPIANEDERAQFQRRLGILALLVFLLAGGFWLVATISIARSPRASRTRTQSSCSITVARRTASSITPWSTSRECLSKTSSIAPGRNRQRASSICSPVNGLTPVVRSRPCEA
jgi:hypothetical protein